MFLEGLSMQSSTIYLDQVKKSKDLESMVAALS